MNSIVNKMNLLLFVASFSLLAACNSDSSGGSNDPGSGTGSPVSPQLSVLDLKISAENSLSSVYSVDIDVDISERSTKRAFISICDNSQAQGDVSKVDFDMCLLKGRLEQGVGKFDLRVANHCEELITIIWIMEKDREPLIYTLAHNNQKENYWLIN
ncbi:hypothetical protein ERW49_03005 [Aliivibrio finisterrensis]|uniref:Lipoprotein n=1 Tax=Aliivibrio finisterrensis TaxID=511998 RepID=A0A4Q5KNF8_9GAMM|nr:MULTISPECIES: hypothetical protein [Aliivibrio]MDD9174192.1 hypothetical protein [Aliivibrio sp. S3TY1]MDD9191269.1 hypothetical protein [Aliivibrio sp. S2TY2]RYU48038.1 hypothetical protein ERW49_03005 [Aliivibrio finisterrensis]